MGDAASMFKGGVAVITGAGSGIGSELARQAGSMGMIVIVADVATARAEKVAKEINNKGGKAFAKVVDVSKAEQLDKLAEDVFTTYGSVRLLVNNAGVETLGYAWEIPAARWEATLNINIHGVIHGVRAFLPRMLATGEECWVANLSSIGGFGMMPTQTAYIVTKHAVQSFTECLYLELKHKNAPIHVSAVIPGMLKTSIFDAEAGQGEPSSATRLRRIMSDNMAAYGMELEEGCRRIMEGIAAGNFWCDTQPDLTEQIVSGRIDYLKNRKAPELPPAARALLD
ncbi:NAD(P)-binding protein [Thozetella sp. PMI_491]|nr:NAD(P)-binding protein [Thozetella sp. PMI_491]